LQTFFPPLAPTVTKDEWESSVNEPAVRPGSRWRKWSDEFLQQSHGKQLGDDGLPRCRLKADGPQSENGCQSLSGVVGRGYLGQWKGVSEDYPLRKPDKPNYKLLKAYRPANSPPATPGAILRRKSRGSDLVRGGGVRLPADESSLRWGEERRSMDKR